MGAYGPEMNFFRIKGWVEELCSGLGIDKLHFAAERENQSYHPGRCAKVWCGETYIGILGQIAPRRRRQLRRGRGDVLRGAEL